MILKGPNKNKTLFILYFNSEVSISKVTFNIQTFFWCSTRCSINISLKNSHWFVNSHMVCVIVSHCSTYFNKINLFLLSQQLFEWVIHYYYHILDIQTDMQNLSNLSNTQKINDRTEFYPYVLATLNCHMFMDFSRILLRLSPLCQ